MQMLVLRYCVILCLLSCLVVSASADDTPEEAAKAPPGVTVELIAPPPADDAPATKEDEFEEWRERLQSLGQEPRIKLSYDGEPFGDVLQDLRERLDIMILCADEKLLERSYYRHLEAPQSMALASVCGPLLHQPRPAYVLCAEDELREGELRPEIKSPSKLNIKLEDAVLDDALAWLEEIAGVAMQATETVGDKRVTCEASEVTIAQAIEKLAKAAQCAHTTGFVLEPVDVEEGLRKLEAMSPEDLENMIKKGLQAAAETEGAVFGSREDAKADARQAMHDGMNMFWQLEPQERKQLVNRGAHMVQRLGRLTQRLSPETRAQLQQLAKPLGSLAVAGYIALPAGKRAEIAPLMRALQSFGQ